MAVASRKLAGKSRKAKKPKCLHCKNPVLARGVCSTCMRKIREAIADGKFTDEQAVQSKMLLTNRQGAREKLKVDRMIDDLAKRHRGARAAG